MGVGADHDRDPAVEKMREGHLLAGRLAVEVDRNGRDGAHQPVLGQPPRGKGERIVERVHEQSTHRVQHQDLAAAMVGKHPPAPPRGRRRVVVGPQQSLLAIEMRDDLALVEDVVAGGDDIRPGREEQVANLRRDAESAGRVLAVDDHEIEVERPAQPGQFVADDAPPGPPHHIAADQQPHRPAIMSPPSIRGRAPR